MVKKQNAYKNKFLMNLKACLDNSEFQNIIHWTTDNTFKIENLDTFIKKSKDIFKSKNLFLRNLRDFCFNIIKNNHNGISLYHAQFKKGITAEEIKKIKRKQKKNNTYSFNEIKSKLLSELEKEKENAKQEKEIEELKELKKIIAIKLLNRACMEIKKKKKKKIIYLKMIYQNHQKFKWKIIQKNIDLLGIRAVKLIKISNYQIKII